MIRGWDCIEFWVGNARTTAGFLMSAFGFRCTAYAGPETGVRDQGELRARAGRHPLRRERRARRPTRRSPTHVRKHGDGVHDLAWLVDDARRGLRRPRSHAVRATVREPWIETDDDGELELAQVAAYGDTVHTFVNRARYRSALLEPGYVDRRTSRTRRSGPPVGLARDRPRRRQRRAGPARRLGATSTATCSASPSCCTSTTSQIRTEYSALDLDRRVERRRRS